MISVAVWYLFTGLVCIAIGTGAQSLSPWTMGLPFAAGQFLAAFLLWHSFGGGDAEL
jgi:hypothetical protein